MQVRKGLNCLSQRIIGSNTIVQGALPAILEKTPQKFYDDIIRTLYVSIDQEFVEFTFILNKNYISGFVCGVNIFVWSHENNCPEGSYFDQRISKHS